MNQIARVDTSTPARIDDALGLLYSGRSEQTVRAYRQDMEALAAWSGEPAREVLSRLATGTSGAANHLVMRWRADMLDAKLSPATINRRLAALKSVLRIAKTIGLIDWTLEVKGVRSEAYRDTRGPSLSETETILSVVRQQGGPISIRNEALVRCLYDLALRRAEVACLDVSSIDVAGSRLMVLGKGKRESIPVTVPAPTMKALKAWLEVRGLEDGPLFVHIDRHGRFQGRLTGNGIYAVVTTLAGKAGLRARPHGLRHGAITRALDLTKGDYRAVRQFSRHANVQTVVKYDDNRADKGGEVAAMVAGSVSERE